jgi:hypothetical protein
MALEPVGMAECLGARDSIPLLPARSPPRDLHHPIEALKRQPAQGDKTKGHFPNEDAAAS